MSTFGCDRASRQASAPETDQDRDLKSLTETLVLRPPQGDTDSPADVDALAHSAWSNITEVEDPNEFLRLVSRS